MKIKFWTLIVIVLMTTIPINAENYQNMEPLKLETPEMKPELVKLPANPFIAHERSTKEVPTEAMDFRFFKQVTNPDVVPYKFMDDLTFAGVPLFIAGIIAKSEKTAFRQNDGSKHVLLTDFKTGVDDYLQFFGPVATVGLKIAGYEGRSDWPRLFTSAAMSYGIMAVLVNSIKYTAKEMRPDGSTANSWPSGHTATAFVGATMLHKEYGLTRSPWFSVLGYGTATATGVMRVLNNRHWISDVLSGAGIGIMSGELAYALSDLIFKGKGLLRGDISGENSIIDHPSFFSVSMGIGFGTRNIDFDMTKFTRDDGWDDGEGNFNLKFNASTAVAAEGAYFFNKYIGVGGRLRVNSAPIRGWSNIEKFAWSDVASFFSQAEDEEEYKAMQKLINLDKTEFIIKSDHLTEFAADLGLYLNIPLSSRFALGTKFLVGRSIMQEVDLDAHLEGTVFDLGAGFLVDTEKPYEIEWDYFTVGGNNTMKYGTGISLTYAYKSNFSWRVFFDYDIARKTYTMTYDPVGFFEAASPNLYKMMLEKEPGVFDPEEQSVKKNRNTFILGGSFVINF